MVKMIKCECGYTAQAESDVVLVADTQKHAREFHHMELTRDQVLAMAQPIRGR